MADDESPDVGEQSLKDILSIVAFSCTILYVFAHGVGIFSDVETFMKHKLENLGIFTLYLVSIALASVFFKNKYYHSVLYYVSGKRLSTGQRHRHTWTDTCNFGATVLVLVEFGLDLVQDYGKRYQHAKTTVILLSFFLGISLVIGMMVKYSRHWVIGFWYKCLPYARLIAALLFVTAVAVVAYLVQSSQSHNPPLDPEKFTVNSLDNIPMVYST